MVVSSTRAVATGQWPVKCEVEEIAVIEIASQFPAGGTGLWRTSPTAEPWCETATPLRISTGRPFSTGEESVLYKQVRAVVP